MKRYEYRVEKCNGVDGCHTIEDLQRFLDCYRYTRLISVEKDGGNWYVVVEDVIEE